MTYSEPGRGGGFGGGLAGQFAWPPLTPMVKRILIANAAIYVLLLLSSMIWQDRAIVVMAQWFGLDPDTWRALFPFPPLWQLLTYGFVHGVLPGHVLFNMLGLYFFGGMVEQRIGAQRFLWAYLLAIAVAGLVFLVASLLFGWQGPLVGASGGVIAMIVAAAVFSPNSLVIFILFPVPLKILAAGIVLLDVIYGLLKVSGNIGDATSRLAHVSGAAVGFLLVKKGWIWRDPVEEVRTKKAERHEVRSQEDAERVDELLAKISKEGMTSLSKRERDFLKRVSKR